MSTAWINIDGSSDAVSLGGPEGFVDDPEAQYFTQDINSILREAIMEARFPREVMDVFSKRTLVNSLRIGMEQLEKGPVGSSGRRRRRRTRRS